VTEVGNSRLRRGWTTGACATAAAKAAYTALLTGEFPDPVEVTLPRGERVSFALAVARKDADSATAGVVKDAGDDPDVTHGALVLASRSEVKRGEWKQFESAEFNIRPMGSVAYKLGLVAAGRADLTFTLVPKNEWDVAAGAALVESAGGWVLKLDNSPLRCNQKNPLISGLLAGSPFLRDPLLLLLDRHAQTVGSDKASQP